MRRSGLGLVSLLTLVATTITYLVGEVVFSLRGRRPRAEAFDLSRMKEVLVVRIDEIGNAVMLTAFLRELRRNLRPGARITLVVKPAVRPLVERCPYVNRVLSYDQSVPLLLRPLWLPLRALRLAHRQLTPLRPDLAVVPRWQVDSTYAALIAYFSGARWRAGYSEKVNSRKAILNRGLDRLYTHVLPGDLSGEQHARHEVEQNLQLLRCLGGMVQERKLELWISDKDAAFAEQTLQGMGSQSGQLLIGFAPAGGHSVLKQWPVEHFAELGRRLQR